MKPKRVILIRHGQSEANVDKTVYHRKPDYATRLTDLGRQQASECGAKLAEMIKGEGIKFYVSPFWRTRDTLVEIVKHFDSYAGANVYEDPRLREQEWGHLREKSVTLNLEEERDKYGHFYYRLPDGESCADVFDRASDFLQTLFRDFEKPDSADNVGIVTHGMTMRLFLMRWFHLAVEEFELLKNPQNCGMYVLNRREDGKYTFPNIAEVNMLSHKFQYPDQLPWEGPFVHEL